MEQTTIMNLLFTILVINIITLVLVFITRLRVKVCINHIDEKDIEEVMKKIMEEEKIEIL